jgi:ribosomal protein S18 acetylase RimI-like enzyme
MANEATPGEPSVRRATWADRLTMADVFAAAFRDDPLFQWMTATATGLEARSRPYFLSITKIHLARSGDELFVTDDGGGAALWCAPNQWKVSVVDLLRSMSGALRTFRLHGVRALRALAAMERSHPTETHYYLQYLGTRPEQQGKGIGSALMTPMLDRCDAEGLPAFLESSERAIPFYARHGFVERERIAFPRGCPPTQPMWRDPR